MRRLFTFSATLSLALLWAACRPEERPQLPDETLARIMADLHIAEAAATGLTGYRKDSLLYVYHGQIFALHGTDRQTYERDMRLVARTEEHMMAIVEQAERLLQEAKHQK